MMMSKVKLSTPWDTFQKMLKALFEKDKEIIVGDVESAEEAGLVGDFDYVIPIEVKNHEKFMALDRVIPSVKTFGNIKVGIQIYDEENSLTGAIADAFKTIFKGNPILSSVEVVPDFASTEHTYVQFAPEVVQFFNDDISDLNGNWNGLAEDIARDVFSSEMMTPFIHFCTAAKE